MRMSDLKKWINSLDDETINAFDASIYDAELNESYPLSGVDIVGDDHVLADVLDKGSPVLVFNLKEELEARENNEEFNPILYEI